MVNTSEISAAHENSIRQLIGEFGKNCEETVRELYNGHKEQIEKRATVSNYIPILAWRATRNTLQKDDVLC